MNALKIAKTVVFLLSTFLIIVSSLFFIKLTEKHHKINPKNLITSDIHKNTSRLFIPKDEDISQLFSCGEFLCLTTQKKEDLTKIYILNPSSGFIIRKIDIKKE